jgi:hypothetical protein
MDQAQPVASESATEAPVTAYASVTEAALDLGHRTYSGTVAATTRRTEPAEGDR